MTKNRIVELFTHSIDNSAIDWEKVVSNQVCTLQGKRCFKTRKGDSSLAIGTCTVRYGKTQEPIIICPARLLERRQIFVDCLHLLTNHQPGNELHIVPEVSIPGGSVDFFLVSLNGESIADFLGIELQTMDTTGTVWPERQKLLKQLKLLNVQAAPEEKSYGMNWKMTAKTILVQMHHKIHTFEHVNKKLVLIIQDPLLSYMSKAFSFSHIKNPPRLGDSMQLHSYELQAGQDGNHRLKLIKRFSTDGAGIANCLGLKAEARLEMEIIVKVLRERISSKTLFSPV